MKMPKSWPINDKLNVHRKHNKHKFQFYANPAQCIRGKLQ